MGHLDEVSKFFGLSVAHDCFASVVSEESPPITGDGSKTKDQGTTEAVQAVLWKSKKKKDEQEEVQIEVTAKLGRIGVTVTSVDGDLSHIIVGGRCLRPSSCNLYTKRTELE